MPRPALLLFAAVPLLVAAVLASSADVPAPVPLAAPANVPFPTETAVFAGGCFWSMEKVFEHVPGVVRATSGFTGGTTANPSYASTFTNPAGHVEAVEVVFDPLRITYPELVRLFWHNVDPTAGGGQFCDQGETYRAALFPQTADQRRVAAASLRQVDARFSQPIRARIRTAAPFYAAEDVHQDFADRNPARYEQYRRGCRRDVRLREIWGDLAGVAGARI